MTSVEVLSSTPRFSGHVFSVRTDELRFPTGEVAARDVVRHPGAVGVVAVDEQHRVMLISQYRHAVGRRLLELPAGLLDAADEPASATAARELAEEVGLQAGRWEHLLDALSSAGMTDEAVRVFLARDISQASDTGFVREAEEADLAPRWVPLVEAVDMVADGRIVNALCVMGVLAAARVVLGGAPARPAAQPWPDRPAHAG